MDIVDINYNDDGSVTVTYSDGRKVTSGGPSGTVTTGTTGTGSTTGTGTGTSTGSNTGWLSALAAVLGSAPGILSSIFGGNNSNNNTPVLYTDPNGNTNVNMAGNSMNSILIIALVLMVAFFAFSGKQPIQTAKRR